MKRIGLIVKTSNPKAVRLGSDMAGWVKKKGGEVCAEPRLARMMRPVRPMEPGKLVDAIDVMVVLGGDGTMISAARILDGRKVPILGINLGGLGFLTSAAASETRRLVGRVLRDDYDIEERMLLSVELKRGGRAVLKKNVLNDAVIKGPNARLVRLDTRINGEFVNTYRADGIIIATPTGSTAYSLSANGPILYPTIHSIIVAPICPFNLTNRPVVIPDWMKVEIAVSAGQKGMELILDGQVDVPMESGDAVIVKRAEASVYLVKYEGKSYFGILRERLMWEVKR